MTAGERFYSKMYALMTLEIMVPVETLRALIALERSIVVRLRLCSVRATVHVL